MIPLTPETYLERVYAGWLGKCIGVRLGAPIENWTYVQIRNHIGEIHEYFPVPDGKIFQPDDDTNVPLIFLHALEDYGPLVTAQQMGLTLLNYLGDQHGSLWWGGYGISSEHTAYLNLKAGIAAPASGSADLNGTLLSTQIGGQIFSDLWGLLVPGNPARASELARRAASVTHDGEGLLGGMFIAAMTSAAFTTSDPQALVQAGLEVIPAGSEYARMAAALLAFYRQHPDDWQAAYQFIYDHFGYGSYPGIVPIIPNAGLVLIGLLYSGGDFSRAICITSACGWDTDCNVGNVGAILGVAAGLEGIEPRWRQPVNDTIAAASLAGARNLADIANTARRIAALGLALAGDAPLPPAARAGFDLPGSLHGFQAWGEQRNILLLRQAQVGERGVLKAVVRLLKKKQELRVYQETYYPETRLNSTYYAAGFSPTLYPGQTLSASLYLPAQAPAQLLASLYTLDAHTHSIYQSQGVQLQPGTWQRLEWRIPPLADACLIQAGVSWRNLGADTWKGEFWLDDFDWSGRPHFSLDFQNARAEYGALSQWTFLRGYWRLQDGACEASGPETSEMYTGDLAWDDLSLRVRLRPLRGEYHQINLRVQGALRSYALGLAPHGQLVLYKKTDGVYLPVQSAPFAWEMGHCYELSLTASAARLEAAVDGQGLLAWQDCSQPYLTGQIGLSNRAGCRTRFEAVYVE